MLWTCCSHFLSETVVAATSSRLLSWNVHCVWLVSSCVSNGGIKGSWLFFVFRRSRQASGHELCKCVSWHVQSPNEAFLALREINTTFIVNVANCYTYLAKLHNTIKVSWKIQKYNMNSESDMVLSVRTTETQKRENTILLSTGFLNATFGPDVLARSPF